MITIRLCSKILPIILFKLTEISIIHAMILSVHLDPKFKKSLNELREKGGSSSLAAKKADDLINRLLLRGRDCSHTIGKLTKNGELRIKYCKKYDLGNGYRLISLKNGCNLVFLFIGTHDECDRWLERNKGLQYEIYEKNGNLLETKGIPSTDFSYQQAKDPVDEYEDRLMAKIDDKILRKIFWGLCE